MTADGQPLLLALDTSSMVASVALFDGHSILAESTWFAGREHSSRLLVEVQHVLEGQARCIQDVTGVSVAKGPGSFTGVRVALSVAKGLAFGLSVPLWGFDTLEALAFPLFWAERPVRPVLAVGRGRSATALYDRGRCVEQPRLVADTDLAQCCDGAIVTGEIPPITRAACAGDPRTTLLGHALSLRRAGVLAELGYRAHMAGDSGDAAAVDAIYLAPGSPPSTR